MSDNHMHNINIPHKTILTGIGLGVIAWIADALMDGFLHHREDVFRILLYPSGPELLRRVFIMLFVVGISVYVGQAISRLKRSEEKLIESEQWHRSLFETAHDVIFTLSADGVFTSVNHAFETTTGWQSDEALGKNYLAFVHPDDATRASKIFQSVLAGQAPDVFALRIRSRSGGYLTGEITTTPHMKDGRVAGVLGIARDITGRTVTDKALQEKEAKYRDLFENANDLIQSVGSDGKFLYVNRAWRETLGYTEEEVAGLALHDIIHPDFRRHCMDLFRQLTAGEKVDHVEAMFVTKSGRSVVVEGNVNCNIVDGVPVATRGIFRDITEHRLATEFIRNILESVDEGFIVIDRDYRIVSGNKAYTDRLKTSPHDIIGKHCYEVSHHLSRPCYEAGEDCAVRHTFQTGESRTATHIHHDSEGNPVYIETKSFPLKDSLGLVISAIEIHNDITEKKKLEDRFRHSQKMEAVGTLAGGIAHDFNNILTAIIGYGTLLQMKMGSEDPLKPFVDNILISTDRAANLTQSLLAFSRKQVINLQPVVLNTLVTRMEELVTRLIGEDITIAFSLSDAPMTIRADAGQIEQVLMNLASNARDAMPNGGVLTIGTGARELDLEFIRAHGYGRVGRYALLSVTDTGVGMDERTRLRIFEPFFTTKEVNKGTGLGLAIVYGIVKQHNGYIDVESDPGKGAAFMIYLPLATETSETARTIESELGMPEGGRATILVAEDENSVRNLTRFVLEGFGYSVIEAVDGEDAVKKFSDNRDSIDLLFLDIILPKKDGRRVYEEAKTMRPSIKALFTSGYTAEFPHQKGILGDSLNFISKPVSPRELLRKVKEMLDAEPDKALPPVA